jgi:prepilin-type N-terminal cleavage/methylation domain-containing protein
MPSKLKTNFSLASRGFTLIELLIVIAILGLLSSIVLSSMGQTREAAYFVKAKKALHSIHESVEFYKNDNNDNYPPDTSRSVPPGLEQYLASGTWPDATWPGSMFDWENWNDPNTGEKIYQISIRFCPFGKPDECRFPNKDWAVNFDTSSAVFYCIEGSCRPHIGEPPDHPGYCVNCQQPQYPYGIY